jgi:hypothetical protein
MGAVAEPIRVAWRMVGTILTPVAAEATRKVDRRRYRWCKYRGLPCPRFIAQQLVMRGARTAVADGRGSAGARAVRAPFRAMTLRAGADASLVAVTPVPGGGCHCMILRIRPVVGAGIFTGNGRSRGGFVRWLVSVFSPATAVLCRVSIWLCIGLGGDQPSMGSGPLL